MSHHVYKQLELTGSSSLRDGKVAHWQVSLKIAFTLE
ncbi:hypothetical protein BH10PSE16_BH10PSE16_38960 [soil metagenome]